MAIHPSSVNRSYRLPDASAAMITSTIAADLSTGDDAGTGDTTTDPGSDTPSDGSGDTGDGSGWYP